MSWYNQVLQKIIQDSGGGVGISFENHAGILTWAVEKNKHRLTGQIDIFELTV